MKRPAPNRRDSRASSPASLLAIGNPLHCRLLLLDQSDSRSDVAVVGLAAWAENPLRAWPHMTGQGRRARSRSLTPVACRGQFSWAVSGVPAWFQVSVSPDSDSWLNVEGGGL